MLLCLRWAISVFFPNGVYASQYAVCIVMVMIESPNICDNQISSQGHSHMPFKYGVLACLRQAMSVFFTNTFVCFYVLENEVMVEIPYLGILERLEDIPGHSPLFQAWIYLRCNCWMVDAPVQRQCNFIQTL